ncbi:flagellar basal body protein, partial [Escherichia coli]|uniref:flagellar basal body protein n=1 Tax=Escherichia coli TaxID=562 RepID=UPI00207B4D07
MSFTDIYQISGSAMTAQTLRLNTVASNLANANAPASSEAQAYKARSPVFAAVYHHSLLAGDQLSCLVGGRGGGGGGGEGWGRAGRGGGWGGENGGGRVGGGGRG